MFWDEMAQFPDDTHKLGSNFEPSIDIATAMISKIFTQDGQVLHGSIYRPFTPDEISDQKGSDAMNSLWPKYMTSSFENLEVIGLEDIPQYDLYESETQNEQTFPCYRNNKNQHLRLQINT